jgi:hypothetical protein
MTHLGSLARIAVPVELGRRHVGLGALGERAADRTGDDVNSREPLEMGWKKLIRLVVVLRESQWRLNGRVWRRRGDDAVGVVRQDNHRAPALKIGGECERATELVGRERVEALFEWVRGAHAG